MVVQDVERLMLSDPDSLVVAPKKVKESTFIHTKEHKIILPIYMHRWMRRR